MLYKFDINLAKCNTNGMDESYIGPCFSSIQSQKCNCTNLKSNKCIHLNRFK